ncbi:hypothetical protein [Neobacillus sp. PS3-40]|uniref:hypothetical protein n=1 Tax=Neobacillus sp. PS3-40 TaxID=3070679 RepID=UPI0027E06FF4|nr:hypothetical protein [Neobacillus sp. PS3-40]WML45400.1 hypothetical protein RCG20_05720 [Neobacillus sp. PS3-40]
MLFFTKRDRKIHFISALINGVIFTILGVYFYSPKSFIPFALIFFCFVFVIQIFVGITPIILKLFFLNSLHPKEQTKEFEKKIAMIQEEIKRVNGQDYNEDVFYDE